MGEMQPPSAFESCKGAVYAMGRLDRQARLTGQVLRSLDRVEARLDALEAAIGLRGAPGCPRTDDLPSGHARGQGAGVARPGAA